MTDWSSLLDDILARLVAQLSTDAAAQLQEVVVNQGILIGYRGDGTVFEGPSVAIWPETWSWEPFDEESDKGTATLVFTVGRLVPSVPDAEIARAVGDTAALIRGDVGRLRGWLVTHRNLGDGLGDAGADTVGSALVQDSALQSVEVTLEDVPDHGLWSVARVSWWVMWLEPRSIEDAALVEQTIVGATVTDSADRTVSVDVATE